MTKTQITKLLKENGISLDGLTVKSNEVEVYCTTVKGEFSKIKTDSKMKKVSKVLGFGGFMCGYGAWILSGNYQSNGDWNNPASKWHY